MFSTVNVAVLIGIFNAQQEFSAVMPDISLIAYPVDQSGIDLSSWWKHPRTAQLLHREYFKYLASLVTTRLAHG